MVKPEVLVDDIPVINDIELENAIRRLRPGKSPGPDLIDPLLVKFFNKSNLKATKDMLNELLKASVFPDIWKVSRLALIPKPSSSIDVKFRPICMLNCFSKILEYILYDRMLKFVKLSDNQYGFRRGRSTADTLRALKKIYDDNRIVPLRQRQSLCLIGIDVRNAFNSLRWRDVIKRSY